MAARHYCFTLNNPKYLIDLNHPQIRYGIYSEEIGEHGNHHFQGYVELSDPQRFTWFKKNIPGMEEAHFEKRHGTRDQARDYCRKTDDPTFIDGPYEFGEWEAGGQGARNDIPQVLADIKSGISMVDIAETHPRAWVQYRNSFDAYQRLIEPDDTASYDLSRFRHPPLVLDRPILLHGPSGIGKTQFALAHFKQPLLVTHIDDLKKLSSRHDGIVFDDLSFKHMPPETVIHLLDYDTASSIHCRNTNARIPKKMNRIFTHNEQDIFYPASCTNNQINAIQRRYLAVYVEQLF